MKSFLVHITDNKPYPNFLRKLKDGKYFIQVTKITKRSNPQNSYYWSAIVPMVRQGLLDVGYDEVNTNEDAHEVMKKLFLEKKMINKETGEVLIISGSSRTLTKIEFMEYIDKIQKWASEYLGIYIPEAS